MTRNLFLGADLTPAYRALAAQDGLAGLPAAVAAIFNPGEPPGLVQRTDFATRAVALAGEIAAAEPDVIGLQEAAVWRAGDAPPEDHLALLEAELERRGLRYRRVAVKENGSVALPSAAGILVGLADREAMLAREGLDVSNVQTGAFANALTMKTAQGSFSLARGWIAADVERIRCVTTHLEVARPAAAATAQRLQAQELVEGPAATELPVVLLGDFNARPEGETYAYLRGAGFEDAWTQANPDGPAGFTCCHRQGLDNPADTLRARIDLILVRGGATAAAASVVGEFSSGLWPSDHQGVVADITGSNLI
jgi:endonuclease/exonuclease/phosphatase family metal-dependent hydrolase